MNKRKFFVGFRARRDSFDTATILGYRCSNDQFATMLIDDNDPPEIVAKKLHHFAKLIEQGPAR